MTEVGTSEICHREVCPSQARFGEIGTLKVGSAEVSTDEAGLIEVCPIEVCPEEICMRKLPPTKVCLSEVWVYIWIFFPPLVPCLDSLFEYIKMLLVCHNILSPIRAILVVFNTVGKFICNI